jgi:putative ABC transport system permease protein
LSPEEAARRARVEFGAAEYHGERARQARGLGPFDQLRFSWLDLKLGGRMLVKYPVLTIVGGFAMAFGIWVGAGAFEIVRQFVYPSIPLPESDRIVVLQNWDAAASRLELRSTQDYLGWRQSVATVDDIGALRTIARNLVVTEGSAEPATVAEMSAATFRALRVAPLMGRAIVESDEAPDAPLVAVIGFDLWHRRFQGDANILGRVIKIGGAPTTIVGVMPDGFAFPRSHEMWTPLRIDPTTPISQGIALRVVGRLAEGATLKQARAELTKLGRVAAADYPETHQHLRPQVITFGESVNTVAGADNEIFYGHLFGMMLLTLVFANVGLLMFARAATRETEIVVRSALGASRGRIVMQLFAEALVLGTAAAVVGLTAAAWGLDWALWSFRGEIVDANGNYPFWVTGTLSPLTVAYTALLTIVAAVIAGVMPGLKVTRGLSDRLKRTTAGGGGVSFGGLWTAVIVIQIAITMAFPVVTSMLRRDARTLENPTLPFAIDRFLAVRVAMERTAPGDTSAAAFQSRFVAAVAKLEDRLVADPGVEALAFAQLLPRQYHTNHEIEVDEGAVAPPDERGHNIGTVDVEPTYFDVLGISMLSGRGFNSGDLASDARVAIVDKPFVDRVLGGKNPVGRRLRYPSGGSSRRAADTLWYEIVGMAPDVGIKSGWGSGGVYHPLQRASQYPVQIAVRVRGRPADFAPRLRAIATDADATLQLSGLMPIRDLANNDISFAQLWVRLTTIFSMIGLTLSLVAIYAVMSYTVSRRTREIGVRVALGASPRRVFGAVFAQPLRQVGLGLLGGAGLVTLMFGETRTGWSFPGVAVTMVTSGMAIACALACIVPTRRALAVQPMDALRSD